MPAGVSIGGIGRQYVTLVPNNTMFEGPRPGAPAALDPGAPPVLLLGGEAAEHDGSAVQQPRPERAADPGNSPATALFGLQITIPLSTVNVSAVQWTLGSRKNASAADARAGTFVPAYGNARQVWATNVPACGSWFFNARCSDIFWQAPGYAHALATVTAEGPATMADSNDDAGGLDELRWHTWY